MIVYVLVTYSLQCYNCMFHNSHSKYIYIYIYKFRQNIEIHNIDISHVYTATNREGSSTARQKSWQCKRVEHARPGATFWWAEPSRKR